MVTDNYWFENALLKVNQECLNKILKDDDILVLQQYFVMSSKFDLIAGEKRQCDYWSSVLKKSKYHHGLLFVNTCRAMTLIKKMHCL